jgi:hypothetical protein
MNLIGSCELAKLNCGRRFMYLGSGYRHRRRGRSGSGELRSGRRIWLRFLRQTHFRRGRQRRTDASLQRRTLATAGDSSNRQ